MRARVSRKWYLVVIVLLYVGLLASFSLNVTLLMRKPPVVKLQDKVENFGELYIFCQHLLVTQSSQFPTLRAPHWRRRNRLSGRGSLGSPTRRRAWFIHLFSLSLNSMLCRLKI